MESLCLKLKELVFLAFEIWKLRCSMKGAWEMIEVSGSETET